ncbi:MAG TPA: PqqD family peptide modification chaperone [Candidatus Binatia bacterium]|jgi:hypothetical protein|nr:PqqD family peptide modification chaperone [Candidatus Binatia bacterium]
MPTQLSRSTTIKAIEEQLSCDLAGEAVILSLKSGEYFGLNELGARIWNLIQKPRTLGELVELLMLEYEVAIDQLERDLTSLLDEMCTQGLVDVEDEKSA